MREAAAVAAHDMTTQLAAIMRTVQPLSLRLGALEERVAASAEAPSLSAAALEGRIAALEASRAALQIPASPVLPGYALLEKRIKVLEAIAAASQPAGQTQPPPLSTEEQLTRMKGAAATTPAASNTAPHMGAETAVEALPRPPSSTPTAKCEKKSINSLPTAKADQPASMQLSHGMRLASYAGSGAVLCQQGVRA